MLARRLQPNFAMKGGIGGINPNLDTELVRMTTMKRVGSSVIEDREACQLEIGPGGLFPSLSNFQHDIRASC